MEAQHTLEPWEVQAYENSIGLHDWLHIRDSRGLVLFSIGGDSVNAKANARRIVACVNACRGIPLKELEELAAIAEENNPNVAGVALMAITNADLSDINDELAEALREVTESLELEVNPECGEIVRARAILAKLK